MMHDDIEDQHRAKLYEVARELLAKHQGGATSLAGLTLEEVLTSEGYRALDASPLQVAITRAAEGRTIGDAIGVHMTKRHFGCEAMPASKPRRVVLIGGIRGGKSLMSCCAAIHGVLTADLSRLTTNELPRFAIIGPAVDAAKATYVQLCGILTGSPKLSCYVEGEPTAERVIIRRPDGYRVEIVVVAAHRGGLSVRNRWLTGFVLEEVASFGSESTGAAVNAEGILQAAETRLLPGCQGWLISSPFGPMGLLWELYREYFGKPGDTIVIHAPTRALNPSFPQERIDEIEREDPDTAAREYNAEWIDADSAFLPAVLIDKATRAAPTQRSGRAFAAAMDPATRGNSWTLACGWSEQALDPNDKTIKRTRVVIAAVWQWTGSKKFPLSPRAVLKEAAGLLAPYGVASIYTDQWSLDALAEHAQAAGLRLVEHEGDKDMPYVKLRTLLQNELIELPPDPVMRQDLLAIRQRASANGVKVHLPLTADGRHCDYAPSVSLVAHYAEENRPFAVSYESASGRHGQFDPSPKSRFHQHVQDQSDGGGRRGGKYGGMG